MSSTPVAALFFCGALLSCTALAQPPAPSDSRRLVEMPAESLILLRQDMISHLATLHSIIVALGNGDLKVAADTAEQQLGRVSMGRHRATGMGPGRFMPEKMRSLGWNMHDAADNFAMETRKGNIQGAYAALQNITESCVACHAVYRTK